MTLTISELTNGLEFFYSDSFEQKDALKARGYRFGERLLPDVREPVKGWYLLAKTQDAVDLESDYAETLGIDMETVEVL